MSIKTKRPTHNLAKVSLSNLKKKLRTRKNIQKFDLKHTQNWFPDIKCVTVIKNSADQIILNFKVVQFTRVLLANLEIYLHNRVRDKVFTNLIGEYFMKVTINDRQEKILDFQDLLEALEMNIKFPAQNVEKLQESRQRTQDKLWEIICSRKYQHST